jgi:hypothetical protein
MFLKFEFLQKYIFLELIEKTLHIIIEKGGLLHYRAPFDFSMEKLNI